MTLKMARLSAFTATMALTAAIFLLPATTGERKPTQVSFVSQVHLAR